MIQHIKDSLHYNILHVEINIDKYFLHNHVTIQFDVHFVDSEHSLDFGLT